MEELIEEYITKGLLRREKTGTDQVKKFLKRAGIDLRTAEILLDIDRLNSHQCSYAAMSKMGRGLILFYGLRPEDGEQHKTVVNLCGVILGEKFQELIKYFDTMRKRRNSASYDEPDTFVSEREAKNAVDHARLFQIAVIDHLAEKLGQKKLL